MKDMSDLQLKTPHFACHLADLCVEDLRHVNTTGKCNSQVVLNSCAMCCVLNASSY